MCQILDMEKAKASEAVAYQCWRNTVFAEWMAARAAPGTRAFFGNLTRAGYEIDSFEHFHRIVRPEFAHRAARIRWEDLFVLASLHGDRLLRYAVTRGPEGDYLLFTVHVRNDGDTPQPVKLKAICHPGDEGEPVITVLVPDED